MALPRLEQLFLGRPCFENACATAAACLLPLSIHCVKLQELEIHFNTTNIVDDLENTLDDSRFQELRSLPGCTLWRLIVYRMPLILDEPDFENVANGMISISHLWKFVKGRRKLDWERLTDGVAEMWIFPVCHRSVQPFTFY